MNCPNCGAPLRGEECAYCGSVMEMPVELMIGKDVSISFSHDGRTYEFKVRIDELNLTDEGSTTHLYSDAMRFCSIHDANYVMYLKGSLVDRSIGGRSSIMVVREGL